MIVTVNANHIRALNLLGSMAIIELPRLLVRYGEELALPLMRGYVPPTIMPKAIPLGRTLTIESQNIIKNTIRVTENYLLFERIAVETWIGRHAKWPVQRDAHSSPNFFRGLNNNPRCKQI